MSITQPPADRPLGEVTVEVAWRPQAAGFQKNGALSLSHCRGGFSTQIHMIADALDKPIS